MAQPASPAKPFGAPGTRYRVDPVVSKPALGFVGIYEGCERTQRGLLRYFTRDDTGARYTLSVSQSTSHSLRRIES